MTAEEIVEVLRISHEIDNPLDVRVDGDAVMFLANVGDTFAYATADAEPIETAADVVLLRQCVTDLRATGSERWEVYVETLYASRKRGMRPMSAVFRDARGLRTKGEHAIADLLEAAGPPPPWESNPRGATPNG